MKQRLIFILISMSIIQIAKSQDIRYRNPNDVVFDIIKPCDEAKNKLEIPANLLQEDIDLFVKTIEDIGVNPYINFSKELFYKEIILLKNMINHPMTRREFLIMFEPIVNDLKLSHTCVYKGFEDRQFYDKSGGKYLPIDVIIEERKLFIDNNFSLINLPTDKEVLSINNIQSRTIIDSLYRYAEGATEYSKLMDIQNNFSFLLWWVYNLTDTFQIKTKQATYTIKGLSSFEIDKLKNEKSNNQSVKEYKQYEYCQVDSVTSKLTFRDFMIKDEASYYRFLDSAFLQLRKKSIKDLIIDVRDNPGGGDGYGIEVVKYLYDKPFKSYSKFYYKKSKINEDFSYMFLYPEDRNNPTMRKAANNNGTCESEHEYGTYYECENKTYNPKPDSIIFKGNVYVLSNYLVYSAGNTFVGLVKDYKIGEIIGTETGQSFSNDGQGCWFLLPYSNILARGSTTLAIRPNGDPSTKRGIIPDYEVKQSMKDIEKSMDTILDFTMNLIKQKKN